MLGVRVHRERQINDRAYFVSRLCNRLRSSIFESCRSKVNPQMYYKACLQDMCECPSDNCYCESFMAYAHDCQRLGIQLPHWRKSTRCRTVWDTTPRLPAAFLDAITASSSASGARGGHRRSGPR